MLFCSYSSREEERLACNDQNLRLISHRFSMIRAACRDDNADTARFTWTAHEIEDKPPADGVVVK